MWSPVECITSAEELNKVFNDPESERKVSQIRQYLFAGDKNNAQKVKETLPGLIFVADDFDVTEKLVPVWENGEKKEVLQYIKYHNLYLSQDSKKLGFSFRSLDGNELLMLKREFPDDYQKILRLYPFAGAGVKRAEEYGKK